MAKKAKAESKPAAKPTTEASVRAEQPNKGVYLLLFVIAALVIVAIVVSVRTSQNNMSAWATIHANQLHVFMSDCRSNGGTVDVRPNEAPNIVFVCQYPDRMEEYTLEPGRPKK